MVGRQLALARRLEGEDAVVSLIQERDGFGPLLLGNEAVLIAIDAAEHAHLDVLLRHLVARNLAVTILVGAEGKEGEGRQFPSAHAAGHHVELAVAQHRRGRDTHRLRPADGPSFLAVAQVVADDAQAADDDHFVSALALPADRRGVTAHELRA